MSKNQHLNLHDYIPYYRFKPKSEFIQIDARYKEIAQSIGEALEHLHDLGIVLRDIDIYNIMMDDISDNSNPRISSIKNSVIMGPENTTFGMCVKNCEF